MSAGKNGTAVWDFPLRVFHWALVAGFATAYWSAEYHHGEIHALIGYFLCILLSARLVWGFLGSRYSRFDSFIFPHRETAQYLRGMLGGKPRHYFGHNPAGALMVFAMLALLALILFTGLATLSLIDFEGPLPLFNYADDETSYAIRHLHAFLINIALTLIALHLLGVVAGSIQHGENLVGAMITGRKANPMPTGANPEILKNQGGAVNEETPQDHDNWLALHADRDRGPCR